MTWHVSALVIVSFATSAIAAPVAVVAWRRRAAPGACAPALLMHALWVAERACTIPYDPAYRAVLGPIPYMGASLPAFVRLLGLRGYSLIGVERLGFNAVFVRDACLGRLVSVTAADALRGPVVGLCQAGLAVDPTLGADVRARPWVDV